MASKLHLAGTLKHIAVRQLSVSAASQQLVKPSVQLYGTEGRYAHALFSAAAKKDSLQSVEKEVDRFKELLKRDKLLSAYIMDPSVGKVNKQDVLRKTLKKHNYSDLTINFIGVLAENSRLPHTVGVIQAFETLMRAHRGEVQCTVTTAKKLDGAQLDRLQSTLQRFIQQGQKLTMKTKIEPALIGGMVVDVGEFHIDMSIAAKIKKITASLRAEV